MLRFICSQGSRSTIKLDFNTSHVTVYRHRLPQYLHKSVISIHLMLRFIHPRTCRRVSLIVISIHLMLRFICNICYCMFVSFRISIHLMLRFIMEEETGWNPGSYISIHLMLRFIAQCRFCGQMVQIFQYISCYGLSLLSFHCLLYHHHFNTSHVTVYHLSRWGKSEHFRISIHLMLRFIRTEPEHIWGNKRISIHLMLRFIEYGSMDAFSILWFQYISCYGLSFSSINYLWFSPEFQYISCYGLSNDFKPFLSWHLSSFPLFYVISTFFTSRL